MFENRFNIVSLTDWHVPFHDPLALEEAFRFCDRLQPQIIVMHECHDFYAISRFDKDPSRTDSLQAEIDQVTAYFRLLRAFCPRSKLILLKSNHLDRLRRYIWRNAPALHSLRKLQLPELLEFEKNDITYLDNFVYKDVLFKHGDLVRKDAGMTARAEFTKEGMSGASGHTHRLASHYRRLRGGEYVWLESGCLCSLEPEYVDGTVDWQHGISLVSFKREDSNKYFPVVLPMIDYEIPL